MRAHRTSTWPLALAGCAVGALLGWGCLELGAALAARGRGPLVPAADQARIAVFSPAAVEILFAIGAGAEVVGVTRYATRPSEARRRPDLGGLIDPNLERLASLAPTLVVTQGENPTLARFCSSRGLRRIDLTIETVGDVARVCRELGRAVGREAAGEALALGIERELAALGRLVAGRPRVPCFLSVDRQPGTMTGLLTAGRGSFLTEVVALAGGRNIFDDLPLLYPVVSKEALIERAPAVVLELMPEARPTEELRRRLTADWAALAGLPAVRDGRIELLARDDALLPGPRLPELARAVARALNPEVDLGQR